MQQYLAFGAKRNDFIVKRAFRTTSTPGFTPHIIENVKVIGQNVKFRSACSMHDCDCKIWFDSAHGKWAYEITYSQNGLITLAEWNAWVMYKHDPDYTI